MVYRLLARMSFVLSPPRPPCPRIRNTPRRTKVVEKELTPEWDETFEFAVKDHTRALGVTVMDADIMVNETMGAFSIKLEDMLHKHRVRRSGFFGLWCCMCRSLGGLSLMPRSWEIGEGEAEFGGWRQWREGAGLRRG